MQKITPNLWFDTEAEEAANFYTSIFKDSEVVDVAHYGEAGPRPAGMVMTVTFRLQGQEFTALNGGPEFKFNESISFLVNCESQEEVDEMWEKLSEGGEQGPLRLAEGQVWCLMADRAHCAGAAAARRGSREGESGYESDASDEKDRHRRFARGIRRLNSD